MKVGLFSSVYFNNIGNAFIDYGAEMQLHNALPKEAILVKISQCANFSASLGWRFELKYNPVVNWIWTKSQKFINRHHDSAYVGVSNFEVFNPLKIIKLDYLIIPGCVLTYSFFKIYGHLLADKVSEGCKLIFWAASGNYYSESEVICVNEWLTKLHPYAISFRDNIAYFKYKKYTERAYNGIDNVFFVNLLDIPKCETNCGDYCIVNFDAKYNKKTKFDIVNTFSGEKTIIYMDHEPYPYRKIGKLAKQNVMCSDYPLDYLILYKNVDVTYSDRVHACIPTLSFGNKAQLFSDSPRIALFENVGIELNEITKYPISLNQGLLKDLQGKQIEFLASLFN